MLEKLKKEPKGTDTVVIQKAKINRIIKYEKDLEIAKTKKNSSTAAANDHYT